MKTKFAVQSTTDYSQFRPNILNRTTGENMALKRSMVVNGFIPGKAITVRELPRAEGGYRYEIVFGHHRFSCAKSLGIPVYFIVDNTARDIIEIERIGGAVWTISDHAQALMKAGDADVKAVYDFAEKHKIPFGMAASLLGGEGAGSSNKSKDIKLGKFKLGDQTHALDVVSITDACRESGIEFFGARPFVAAVSDVLCVEEFDKEYFIERIKKNPSGLRRRSTKSECLDEIESFYNYNTKTRRIALKYRSLEESRKRQEAFGK